MLPNLIPEQEVISQNPVAICHLNSHDDSTLPLAVRHDLLGIPGFECTCRSFQQRVHCLSVRVYLEFVC